MNSANKFNVKDTRIMKTPWSPELEARLRIAPHVTKKVDMTPLV